MKLLFETMNEEYIYTSAALLRSKGIMTNVMNEFTHGLRLSVRGKLQLWVVFDEQLQDARGVLENGDYVVTNPLSEDQMHELEIATSIDTSALFNVLLKIFGTVLLISCLIIAWLIKES